MRRSVASRSSPGAPSAPENRSEGITKAESRMRRSMVEGLPWRTLCARKQIMGNIKKAESRMRRSMASSSSAGTPSAPGTRYNKSKIANATLYGFEELPWRTLCARKQIVETTKAELSLRRSMASRSSPGAPSASTNR